MFCGACCCKDNVQASLILGIVRIIFNCVLWGTVLSLFTLSGNSLKSDDTDVKIFIAVGIIYTLICGILVLGAIKRNSTLLLVWMVSACINILHNAISLIILFLKLDFSGQSGGSFVDIGNGFLILIWLFAIGVFAVDIWTLIIVKGARMDIGYRY